MTETTIQIPGNIKVNKISEEIIYKAFAIAIEQKKKEIRKELKLVNSKIKRWEQKYRTSFEKFEQTFGDGFEEHNDWMDWSLLIENRNQLLEEIQEFEIT